MAFGYFQQNGLQSTLSRFFKLYPFVKVQAVKRGRVTTEENSNCDALVY